MASRNNAHQRAHIVGWGMAVPDRVLTNAELTQMVETSDEWIRQRTGIVERHIAGDEETTSTLSVQAAQAALEVADLDPAHLDLIIVATVTPDYAFPSTACLVQDALGATDAAAFDLSAGCSGFVYGVGVAADMIVAGNYKHALVIGAETLSRITDWTDRNTCVLFGDGAGAVVLQGYEAPGGVLSSVLGADGSGGEVLIQPGGGSVHPATSETVTTRLHYVRMQGRIPRTRMPDLLRQYDILLFPSIVDEALPRMPQEAMVCGLVVVGTTTGGTRELLKEGETGLTFEPEDFIGLAEKIYMLIRDPDLYHKLSENGKGLILKHFTMGRMVDKIESYLLEVIR